ncbi:unnamed protein product [Schistosoma intercalatum]|nr:unnamed protein product [Schistosoma intercalatum]
MVLLPCKSTNKLHASEIVCEGSRSDIEGYKFSYVRYICVIIGCVLTAGLLRLLFHWYPQWMLWCTHKTCGLKEADKVMIKDISGIYIHKVHYPTKEKSRPQCDSSTTEAFLEDRNKHQYIIHKKLKYIWNCGSERFELLEYWDKRPYHEVLNTQALTADRIKTRRSLYGINKIDISLTPIIRLVLNGCLTPFHCFQVFSCVIWYCVEYEIYATCIVVFSVISLIFQVYELRKNERSLKRTVCVSAKVGVCRRYDGKDDFMLVDSTELVPGDLIAIPSSGCLMQCDAVLLMGNCIVNESSLTGESLPITKIPLPNGQYENTTFDFRSCPRHILFSGTSVIQTRGDINKRVLAVVIRTGFMTTKGELVRSIMFPKPMKFKFTQDAYQFLGALCGVALVSLCVTIYLMYWNKKELYYIILRPLDIVTIVIPPVLPVAMSVGIVFAQRRLRNHGIYCINQSVMNVCGVINLTCFDKTGTLTEDGLDLWGVVPNRDGVLGKPEFEPSKLDYGPLVECMATCHSLTRIDGVLSGDPLDVKMFQSTKWEFIEVISEDQHNFDLVISAIVRPKKDECGDTFKKIPYEIGIVRQFPFSSSVQRMSVITRTLNESQFHVYTKGAPETIEVLCRRDTIPTNFHSNLLEFTREGFRVLALAWRPIKASYLRIMRISRDRVEHNLLFLGLLVMENRLKPESGPVIKTLRQANIRPVMVTGDHMLTSLSVARDCEMIDELDRVVIVTARPPPCPGNDFDSDVLNESQPIPVPNIGLSTEKNPNNIQDATNGGNIKNFSDDLINSLVQFHYAEDLNRPVTEVATTSIQLKRNLTKTDNSETSKQSFSKRLKKRFNFGRLQIGYTHAYPYLSAEPPTMRLLSMVTMISLFGQVIIGFIIQATAFILIRFQSWYMPLYSYSNTAEYKNYENAAVFIVSTYQYIILAIAFSKGTPYRKSFLTNYAFVLNILVCFALSLYLTTYPVNWILERLQLVRIPSIWFILILHSMVLANFMASYIVESIVDGVSFRRRIRRIRRALFPRRVERKAYERIREEIDRSAGVWPPLLRSASLQALPRDLFTDENLDVTTRPRSRRLSSAVSNDTDVDVASVQSEITDRRQLPFSSTDGDIGLHKVVSKHFSNQMSVNENPNQTFTLGGSLKKRNLSVDSLQHHTVYDPDVFDHSSVSSTPSALEVPVIESMSSHLRNEGEENRE